MRTVYSISAKASEDMEFLEKVTEQCKKKGRIFSHVAIQALKNDPVIQKLIEDSTHAKDQSK